MAAPQATTAAATNIAKPPPAAATPVPPQQQPPQPPTAPRTRLVVQRTLALPHLLAAVATLMGGTAYSGEQGRQRFTFRGNTLVAPRAAQCAPRRGTARCPADGGLLQGHTVHHTTSLLQAASPASASPWPAGQLARWPTCPLLTSTTCTNLVNQLSLEIVPSPTGPINHHINMSQVRFWPRQGQTTHLGFSVGATSLKLCPHTPTSSQGPTGRCMLQQTPPQWPTAPSVQLVHTEACLALANSPSPSWPTMPLWGRKFNQKPTTATQPPHGHY